MMKYLVTVIFLLLVSASVHAQRVSTTTGNQLLERCQSTDTFEQSFCLGYLEGVTDLNAMHGSVLPVNQRSCAPENVTNGQIRDVAVKYLKDHPEERHMLAAILIVKGMAEAFPCTK